MFLIPSTVFSASPPRMMPYAFSCWAGQVITDGSQNFLVVSPEPVSSVYTSSKNYSSLQQYFNENVSFGSINFDDATQQYFLSISTAAVPSVFPAFMDRYDQTWLLSPTSDLVTIVPFTFEEYQALFDISSRFVPPNHSEVLLASIDTKMDKLVGDPANDSLVPEALRGKITSPQYFSLMGLSGLFAAFVAFQIWSRAF